jgi:rhodanese-related sulfurtransferase
MNGIDAATLRAWIVDGRELAILDAREEGEFGTSHLFWAVPCPLSRAEQRAPALLPCRSVRVVCVDDGRGVAEQLAEYLSAQGYAPHVLTGGTKAWEAAGFVLFSGINVPSKAFGEWVEHHFQTESVDAPELNAWIESGRDMVVLDSRTVEEYRRMAIPTGMSVPGGELAYRIGDLVPNPETLVVINCAGRTRSILGAESLRQAGIPNKVVALRNGTMGWELAGLSCIKGASVYPSGRPASAATALQRASAFATRSGVEIIDAATLAGFEADASRTTYVLDVRDPREFAQAARPRSQNAPGGQLVQATDRFVCVRGARVVLICDDGVRARMSAAWLRQMGHEAYVSDGALADAVPPLRQEMVEQAALITPAELAADPSATVVDLQRSVEYRSGHIPGALWAVRTRLDRIAQRLALADLVVLASSDGDLAHLAASEARALTRAEVRVLEGGVAAWRAEKRPMEADRRIPADAACVDVYLPPYDRNENVPAAMQAYLSWEVDLVHEIVRDGTVHFGV